MDAANLSYFKKVLNKLGTISGGVSTVQQSVLSTSSVVSSISNSNLIKYQTPVKGVQSGTVELSGHEVRSVSISSVNTSKAFIIVYGDAVIRSFSSSSLKLWNPSSGSGDAYWQVVEFY